MADFSRLKREEAKINAWENLQKAKAEADIRKLEVIFNKVFHHVSFYISWNIYQWSVLGTFFFLFPRMSFEYIFSMYHDFISSQYSPNMNSGLIKLSLV